MRTIVMSARPLTGALAGMVAAIPAPAASPLAIQTTMLVEQRVAAADGTIRTRLVAPAKVVPGDRVVIMLSYRNTGAQPIADVVLADPVPRGMAYRGPYSGSPAPELSVDGRTFAGLGALRVTTGAGTMRQAIADDVTTVRWRLPGPIAAGRGGELAFQAVLK